MSLKWAINGVLDDIYFMAQGLPRLLFTWKPENQLSILNFFEKNGHQTLCLFIGRDN